MKICVYAIAKNEEQFVDRWYNSMKEADEIYVLDTGSTDNTVKLLKDKGVIVKIKKINPWRFDTARIESLKMVPENTDLCVCTDLDEIFHPGWRKELEKFYTGKTRVRYNYNWSLKNNKPLVNFYLDNIHVRKGYTWTHPVHEVLTNTDNNETFDTIPSIILDHYPDSKKSRKSYLKLLELSVKEDPEDDRNMHYLGREYMYYQEYDKCIRTLKKHLNLESSKWKDERSASMRFIARSYIAKNKNNLAIKWYQKAINETPYLREPLIELAMLYYNEKKYYEMLDLLIKAKTIKNKNKTYINEPFAWDFTLDDLLSLAYYYLGLYDESIFYINKALKIDPNNERLKENKKIFLNSQNQ